MARKLYATFVGTDVRCTLTLYDAEAPVTAGAIWQALVKPVRATTLHAIFAGPEIMLDLPPEARAFDPGELPAEHQTCFPGAGDCLWFYQRANAMKGLDFEMWEIGIFYADGGRIFGPLGWSPCTIFARITDNLEAFAGGCRDIRWSGAKTLELGRKAG